MDLSLNWKANDDTNLSKNRLAQNLDQPEEEEPFYADGDQLGEICFQFVQNPYPNLRNLYEISDILVESSSSLIKYLREIKFFQTFGNFINSVTDPNDRIAVLQILLNLSRLPTDVCLDLIEGNDLALKFLKAQIFSTIDEIRYLSLKCLKHFAQDSHLCRFVILFNNLVFDLYSALIGNKNDMKTISLIEKIFTYLLLEDFSDNDIFLLRKIAFDLIDKNFGTNISCRILCSLSEKENDIDPEYINNAQKIIQFLINERNSKCLKYLMKFFFVRSDFLEEATAFFSNNLFQVLFKIFFTTNEETADSFNTKEDKIDWSCKLIGKIIEKVDVSVNQFFEIGFFDCLIKLSIEGNYREKSSSIYTLSRVLLQVVKNSICLNANHINLLLEVCVYCIELIDTIDQNTLFSVFDFILNLIKILNDPKDVISLLTQEETFEQITTISMQNENETLRNKATEIICIVESFESS